MSTNIKFNLDSDKVVDINMHVNDDSGLRISSYDLDECISLSVEQSPNLETKFFGDKVSLYLSREQAIEIRDALNKSIQEKQDSLTVDNPNTVIAIAKN